MLNYAYKIQGINDHTKQYVNTGTGFIIQHKGHHFLVSNYHVFTGKHPLTGKKLEELTDTCTSILVWFRGTTDTIFKRLKCSLYDEAGKLFSLYHADEQRLLDIAVLPLSEADFPPGIRKYTLSVSDIDTSTNAPDNTQVFVVGFPKGYPLKGWAPKLVSARSVTENDAGNFTIPVIHIDDTTSGGMSGSPTFIQYDKHQRPLLIAVNAMGYDFDPLNPRIKGSAFYVKYGWDIIRQMIIQQKVDVDVYFPGPY